MEQIIFAAHGGFKRFIAVWIERSLCLDRVVILEMVGYTAPHQHYPFSRRWPGYPVEGDFIGIIGNWRSRRLGHAVLRGFRNNTRLPAGIALCAAK